MLIFVFGIMILITTNMKNFFLVIAFFIIAISANAQTKTMSNHSIAINTIGTSYNYEQALGGKMTLIGSIGLTMPYWAWHIPNSGWAYAINPVFGLEPRFYYNIDTRSNKGKNTNYNSANYLSLDCYYMFNPIANQNTLIHPGIIISPNWGIRRVYNDRWLLEFSLGAWCLFDAESQISWAPRANLKFGIVF